MKPTKPYTERIIEIQEAIETTDSLNEARAKLGINPNRLDYTDCPRDIMERQKPKTMRQAEKWREAPEIKHIEKLFKKIEKSGFLARQRRIGIFLTHEL